MRAVLFVSLALVACNKENPDFCPAHPGEDGCPDRIDGGPDDAVDAPDADNGIDARVCFGADAYNVCLKAAAVDPVTLSGGTTIDTTPGAAGSLCLATNLYPADWMTAGQPDSCFIVGTTITIPNITIIGTRPVAFVASNTINVTGTVDVASHRNGNKLGPGAMTQTQCMTSTTTPGTNVDGGGGGAGGSFMSKGGDGGDGFSTGNKGTAVAQDATGPTKLRAGCKGQSGGDGNSASTAGPSGEGGGAIYLLAGVKIALGATGIVNASGSAGGACGREAGGGGGGSGGMIVLYAPAITATTTSVLMANGGGGSSGGNNGGGSAGNEPDTANPTVRAAAVTGPGGAGDGGQGAATTLSAQGGGTGSQNLGGGGGGGGVGYIQANTTITDVIASPAVTVIP